MRTLHGPNPGPLRCGTSPGHSGGKPADPSIEDLADELQSPRGQLGLAK